MFEFLEPMERNNYKEALKRTDRRMKILPVKSPKTVDSRRITEKKQMKYDQEN